MTAEIILVAGLGRCGSSLVMQMLDAAGVPTVGTYPAFEDSIMAGLPGNAAEWLAAASGKAIKALDAHRWIPPKGPDYRCIWLKRDPEEQARSMLKLLGVPASRRDRRAMVTSVQTERLAAVKALMGIEAHRHGILELSFESLIGRPHDIAGQIARYLSRKLDTEAMAACVIERPAVCLPYLLENELLARAAERAAA